MHQLFSDFSLILTSAIEQEDLEIYEKSSKVVLAAPLGVKNVILAKLQYIPCDFHDFRGSEGPKINQNPSELLQNTLTNASNTKKFSDHDFLAFWINFWFKTPPFRDPFGTIFQ